MMSDNRFDHLQGKRVFVYGTGVKAEWLISSVNINVVGLLDNNIDNIGCNIFGCSVFDIADAIPLADVIIIAASDIYNDLIYNRIFPKVEGEEIVVYYFDGTVAAQKKKKKEVSSPYYEFTLQDLRDEIDRNDIITFDLFDTLISRRLLEPADIHFAVSTEKDREYRIKRLKYEEELGDAANMEGVFDRLSRYESSWKHLQSREERFEKSLTIPRKEIVALLKYAFDSGKPVYIITDTPHSEKFLRRLLAQHGIVDFSGILVSSELSKTKSSTALWMHFIEMVKNEELILHIGDNVQSDVINPARLGIDTFHVKSSVDLLRESSLSQLFDESTNYGRSVIAGHIGGRVFNSPFSLYNKNGIPCLNSAEDLGYVFYGPIVFSYIAWIAKQSRLRSIDTLLFCARDGYFLYPLFKLFVSKYKEYSGIKSRYFITSRLLLIKYGDLMNTAKIFYSGSMAECLFNRYDMESMDETNIDTNQKKDYIRLCEILEQNSKSILKSMSNTRRHYLSYISSLGLDGNIAIVDPSYNGTIQNNLQRLVGRRIAGFYMNANLSKSSPYFDKQEMFSLYQEDSDLDASYSNIRKYTLFVEGGFFVAPTGTPIALDENGKFKYSRRGKTQEKFSDKRKLYNGVKEYFKDMFDVYDSADKMSLEPKYIDDFVGLFCGNSEHLSEGLKSTFYCDTLYEGFSDYKLFDY